MKEKDIVQYVINCVESSKKARVTLINQRINNWNAYLGDQDFKEKEDWQAQLVYPHVFAKIKRIMGLIKSLMISTRNYFSIEPMEEEDIEGAKILNDIIKFWFNKEKFVDKFVEVVEAAFIDQIGALKFTWDERNIPIPGEERKKEDYLRIDVINGDWIHFDPSSTSGYDGWIVEEKYVLIADLKAEAEEKDYINLKKLKPIVKDGTLARERKTNIIETATNIGWVEDAKIYMFWGDIINQDQAIEYENIYCEVANDQVLIKEPTPNPFWDGKAPYVLINPLSIPFRFPGESLVHLVEGLVTQYNNMLNLLIDAAKFAVLRMYEVDIDAIDNPKTLETGLFPGKVFEKSGSLAQRAIQEIYQGETPSTVFNVLMILDRGIQEGLGMTDILSGLPTIKGSPTATEISTKRQEARGVFDSIAQDLDRTGLAIAVELAASRIIQYQNKFSRPGLKRLLGKSAEVLDNMPAQKRYERLYGNYDYRAKGISILSERREFLEALSTVFVVIGQNPDLLAMLDSRKLMSLVLEAVNIPEVEKVLIDEETAQKINNLRTQKVEMAQMMNVLQTLGLMGGISRAMGQQQGPPQELPVPGEESEEAETQFIPSG